MAHKCRVRCPQLGIEAIYNEMREDFVENDGNNVHAVLLMDFKMKFEPVSGRETTLEHYGKRGVCWHECQLTYFDYLSEYNDGGTVVPKNVSLIIYFDQILNNSNKQDAGCVIGMLGSVLVQFSWSYHSFLQLYYSLTMQTVNRIIY